MANISNAMNLNASSETSAPEYVSSGIQGLYVFPINLGDHNGSCWARLQRGRGLCVHLLQETKNQCDKLLRDLAGNI